MPYRKILKALDFLRDEFPQNDFFILKQSIISTFENLISFQLLLDTISLKNENINIAEIVEINKTPILSGKDTLEKIVNAIKKLLDINKIKIIDDSFIFWNNIRISLYVINIINDGLTWYNKAGFFQLNYQKNNINWERLRHKNYIKSFDEFERNKKNIDVPEIPNQIINILDISKTNEKIKNDSFLRKSKEWLRKNWKLKTDLETISISTIGGILRFIVFNNVEKYDMEVMIFYYTLMIFIDEYDNILFKEINYN